MSVFPAPPQASEQTPDASAGGEDLLGVRIAAALIDLALLSALFTILAATIGKSTVEGGMVSFTLDGAALALYLALVFVYYLALELATGQTVGKLLLSVRVVRTEGGRPSVAAVAIRTLLRVVDWLPALYLVGFITMLATGARRQRLGDLAAKTCVARAQSVQRRGRAAATVTAVVVVLVGVSFYRAGDDDTTEPTAQPTRIQDSDAVQQGAVLLQDDFSDATSGWETAAIEEGETGYVDGAYRIFVQQAGRQLWANTRGDAGVQALRMEFEATQLTGTSGDLVGARCYTDVEANVGYMLGIAPADRGYVIAAFDGDHFRLIESSGEAAAVHPLRQENQLSVDCIALPNGSIVLTLTANGQTLARAEDETGGRDFDAVGLFVDTTNGGAEALFDDLTVTELQPT